MLDRLVFLLFLVVSQYSVAGIAPSPQQLKNSIVLSEEESKSDVQVSHNQQKKLKNRIEHKDRNRPSGSGFLKVFAVIFVAAGLGSMFLVSVLGWWVLLTSLIGVLIGTAFMYMGLKRSDAKVALMGSIGLGSLGMFLWFLGLLGVMMYMGSH